MKTLVLLPVLLLASPPGTWETLKRGDEEVRLYRDSWGIPHVFAGTPAAAFWAQGYLECQDRFAQMDLMRRASKGRASELRGKDALAQDRDRLRRGYTDEELQAMFDAGGERFRAAVTAYTEGVNAWMTSGAPLPASYADLDPPPPWSVTDCVAIGVAMARRFGEAGDNELTVARVFGELSKKVGEEDARKIVDDLLREQDPAAPTTLNDYVKPKVDRKHGNSPGMSADAYALYKAELDDVVASRAAVGMPVYFGSNAWVAGPKKSKSGNPLLYGGPMMGFSAPSICNEIHLRSDGLETAGMSFPGAPGVMIGWNADLAWTTTSGGADLVDVYTLELNPDDPGEYRYRDAWKKFDVIDREIRVRGGAVEKVRVLRSVHGPLAGEPDLKNHRAHAMKMSFWKAEVGSFEGVLDANFATSVAEFQAGMRKIVTSHNFFCATRDGHIGFWYCGAHPVRKAGVDPRFPQDGKGGAEWEGLLAPEKWPQAVDPESGYFGNWNNKPTSTWPYAGFGEIFWGKKILDVIESEPKLDAVRFGQIARLTAYHAYLADYFAPIILEAASGSDDADVKRGVEILQGWDHMSVDGAPGPALIEKWMRIAMAKIFGTIVDPMMLASRDVQRFLADPLLYLLQGENSLVKLRYDYARGRDLKGIVREALKEAMKGEAPSWKEPLIDFGGEVGKVKSMRGRGTYQMVVEMTPQGPRAMTLAAPGQSERPASTHYKDQMEPFEAWGYKPFVWSRGEMK
ncbi:MAG TPA: penicillin acylase family protein [Planctomycetota bacterium]|nr:penicillin acylase family protein [Planctomycetota bacterium]